MIKEREAIKATTGPLVTTSGTATAATPLKPVDGARLADIRSRLAHLISAWSHTGYTYSGQIYREIAMQNSDYGTACGVYRASVLASVRVPG